MYFIWFYITKYYWFYFIIYFIPLNYLKPDTNLVLSFGIHLEEFLQKILGDKYDSVFKYGISTNETEEFVNYLNENGINLIRKR